MTNREPLRDSALSAPPFGYLSGSRVLRGSRSRQQPVSVATIKRGNYGLVETATARCELSGSSTVRGLFQRSGPLGPGSPDLLFWVKGERTVGKGERPVGCSGAVNKCGESRGEVTPEGEQDGCYRVGGGRKVEPEKPKTLNLRSRGERGCLCVTGSGGGADDKGGGRVCPWGTPDGS